MAEPAQASALTAAFHPAAEQAAVAEPTDWLERPCPQVWKLNGTVKQ